MNLHKIIHYLKYMMSGIPAFLVAIGINWFLVSHFHFEKMLSYTIALIFQITINFLVCHYLVFNQRNKPELRKIFEFSFFVIFFQGVAWLTYAVMVKWLLIYYLLAQLINIVGLSIFKFLWASRIFLTRKPNSNFMGGQ